MLKKKLFSHIVLLLVVLMASLLQFHGHDCLGHLNNVIFSFGCDHNNHQCAHSTGSIVDTSEHEHNHNHADTDECALHLSLTKAKLSYNCHNVKPGFGGNVVASGMLCINGYCIDDFREGYENWHPPAMHITLLRMTDITRRGSPFA